MDLCYFLTAFGSTGSPTTGGRDGEDTELGVRVVFREQRDLQNLSAWFESKTSRKVEYIPYLWYNVLLCSQQIKR